MQPERISEAGGKSVASMKYVHLHYFVKTKRWGAWIRNQTGKRIYLGTHSSEYLAARCQDRAMLKLYKGKRRLYFKKTDYDEDEELRNTLSDDEFFRLLRGESRGKHKRSAASTCLRKFMTDGAAGQIPLLDHPGSSSRKRKEVEPDAIIEKFLNIKLDLRMLADGCSTFKDLAATNKSSTPAAPGKAMADNNMIDIIAAVCSMKLVDQHPPNTCNLMLLATGGCSAD